MKIGDKVLIIDHSWHATLDPEIGRPFHGQAEGGVYHDDVCIVVATDCYFPPMEYEEYFFKGPYSKESDILLFNQDKKVFIFIRSCQVKKIGEVCPYCLK